jgi:hypothetical protein
MAPEYEINIVCMRNRTHRGRGTIRLNASSPDNASAKVWQKHIRQPGTQHGEKGCQEPTRRWGPLVIERCGENVTTGSTRIIES